MILSIYVEGPDGRGWIECCDDADNLREAIEAVAGDEWTIADSESYPDLGLCSMPLEMISKMIKMYEEHGQAVYAFAADVLGKHYVESMDPDAFETDFTDRYEGTEPDRETFAERTVTECYEIPSSLLFYFNFEKYADDLELGGDYIFCETDEGTAVFRA